jgi:hypothetical protein
MKPVKSITIIGRRWFGRRNGNTYCSSTIIVDGTVAGRTGPEYGYGTYYEQAAWQELGRLGLTPDRNEGEPPWQYCQRKGIAYHASASDVARERDL